MELIGETIMSPGSEIFREAKASFETKKYAIIPHFFSEDLLLHLETKIDQCVFHLSDYEVLHKHGPSRVFEMVGKSNFITYLSCLMNDSRLISSMGELTSIPQLKNFGGRLYKLEPNSGHELGWHSDLHPGKRVAISINVSKKAYTGGELVIRKFSTGESWEIANLHYGDALIFLIDREYEHRVLPVRGAEPKFAYTGWFLDL